MKCFSVILFSEFNRKGHIIGSTDSKIKLNPSRDISSSTLYHKLTTGGRIVYSTGGVFLGNKMIADGINTTDYFFKYIMKVFYNNIKNIIFTIRKNNFVSCQKYGKVIH